MVFVAQPYTPLLQGEQADLDDWLSAIAKNRNAEDVALIRRACELAAPLYGGRAGEDGGGLLQYALAVAGRVAELRLDAEAVAAALLHALPERAPEAAARLPETIGPGVARLVDGVARMGQIREFAFSTGEKDEKRLQAHIESLRQMLLAMVSDIRVVLIKLAERAQALRQAAQADEETRRQVAREVQDIFAPLANRLGVWRVKWEMEDLAFRYLEPETYRKIAGLLDERRVDRETYLEKVRATLAGELAKADIPAEVTGRPKHIYSIYKKMRRKGVGFSELYDVRAVRILVDSVPQCYAALGVVHNLWQPIPKEFDDYISRPKGNAYQSLHTAVVGPEDKALEVQIRTHDMHRHAELGVAAHWRYKEGGRQDPRFEEKIAWLRQILDWKDDVHDAGEIMEAFKTGLFQDTVYVLTPQGRVIALPRGATPLDFAYHVHTDLGHRCRGAKVDGAIVPLTSELQTGQRVEILSSRQGGPSRDWLNPAQGYVKTARARAKIRHWFKYQHFEENVAVGRDALEKEAHRLGMPFPNLERLAQKMHVERSEELLAAIGRGDITARQAMASLQEETPRAEEGWRLPPSRNLAAPGAGGILVEDVGNLLTFVAKCCRPLPPDAIVGFVTRGRGVAIHRADCQNVRRLDEAGRGRLLDARWGGKTGLYEVEVAVTANDRQGLLRDITEALTREKVNVTATHTLSRGLVAAMRFTVQVSGAEQLERVLAAVREVPGVIGARRR